MAGLLFRSFLKAVATTNNRFRHLYVYHSFMRDISMFNRSPSLLSFRTFTATISEGKEFQCWKCGKTISLHVISCKHCETIQEIRRDFNYFTLFGLNQEFMLNETQLTSKFRQLQAQFHPDKFAGKSQIEQEYSSLCSASLNAAYQTLSDPVERGLYILRLENIQVDESELEVDDQEFLMEIMEINERLTDLEGEMSVANLQKFKTENGKTIEKLLKLLERSFHKDDLKTAKQTLGKLKYYNKIQEKIKSLELQFSIL